jgi:transcriptional adapter 2-alpha
MNYERRLSKEDREIYNCLKPFARFMEESQFTELFEGLILEKNLRQRLNQLKHYKDIGLKTFEDIEKHLETESRNKKEDKKNIINLDYESIGIKLNKFYEKHNSNQNLENELEKILIKEYGFSKNDLIDIKKVIIKEIMSETSKINS